MTVKEIAQKAKQASLQLAKLPQAVKNRALEAMAQALEADVEMILDANVLDLEFAKKEKISDALVARLALSSDKVSGMVEGIRSVIQLPDPVGRELSVMEMDEGLVLTQVTCPIGVIGAIFESRPDAVPQISSLCLKSGNAVILKGGREAQNTNKTLMTLLVEAAESIEGIPEGALQLIETRAEVTEMLGEEENINLLVPRGSNEFVKYIQDHSKIPVLGHSEGICHGYIDRDANAVLALKVVLDSKLQYPAACNAMETLLIHQDIAPGILPELVERFQEQKVEVVGCLKTCSLAPSVKRANESDWDTEYNDLKLSVKILDGLSEAIAFINQHGSGHTDVILTEDEARADRFMSEVDSASVLWNASTRFADGFRYGLGAEIGISTNKTHARGPVGLEGLVIYKYKLVGHGQTVAEYSGAKGKKFRHNPRSPRRAKDVVAE